MRNLPWTTIVDLSDVPEFGKTAGLVYRGKRVVGSGREPSVYCDYTTTLAMKPAPGKHACRVRDVVTT
ncbi:MAG: hypothetical protein M3Y07_10480 [Acidobacteriota bacterium]|nr:hypothetical protein [Acidobacteriota bacterium]